MTVTRICGCCSWLQDADTRRIFYDSFKYLNSIQNNPVGSSEAIRLASRNCLLIDGRRFGSLSWITLIQVIRIHLIKKIFKDISLLGVALYRSKNNTVYCQCNDTGKRSGWKEISYSKPEKIFLSLTSMNECLTTPLQNFLLLTRFLNEGLRLSFRSFYWFLGPSFVLGKMIKIMCFVQVLHWQCIRHRHARRARVIFLWIKSPWM